MTLRVPFRPVLACMAAATLSACGLVDADPHRFENMAESVAAIPVDAQGRPVASADAPVAQTAEAGPPKDLTVEVMDPHALWDARDGTVSAMVEKGGARLAAAAAPAVADAVVQRASARVEAAVAEVGLRPAAKVRPAVAARRNDLVQIGAYSSEAAARAAWARLKNGGAAWALEGLQPVYEPVEVDGRRLTRLKVRVPAAGAAAVCAAAGIDDPWCHRAA